MSGKLRELFLVRRDSRCFARHAEIAARHAGIPVDDWFRKCHRLETPW
jgi:hypothetical protein